MGGRLFQFHFLTISHFNSEISRQIFRVLDLMRMDMTNFVIRTVRPHIQNHLVEYERNKFQEILEGTPSMYNTLCAHLKIGSKYDIVTLACLSCVHVKTCFKPLKSWHYRLLVVVCVSWKLCCTSYFPTDILGKVCRESAVPCWEGAVVWR